MANTKSVRKTARAAAKSKSVSAKSVSARSVSAKSASVKLGSAKIGSAKTRSAAASIAKARTVAVPATWPQAMSTGGAVTAHAIGATTKPAGTNGAVRSGTQGHPLEAKPVRPSHAAPSLSQAAAPWLAPWTQINFAASQLMAPDAMKAAIDRQFQLYQTMARFSPLTLALQLMQGLMPDGSRAVSAPASSRR